MNDTDPTTEEAFWVAIGANPADSLPRLVFADWLEERAATVRCRNPNCKGEGGWGEVDHKEFGGESRVWRKCPACHGTGYVPDGRAALAAALRATADRVPARLPAGWCWGGDRTMYVQEVEAAELPRELFEAVTTTIPRRRFWRSFATAEAAVRDLCRAWVAAHPSPAH